MSENQHIWTIFSDKNSNKLEGNNQKINKNSHVIGNETHIVE